ncbi:hypothetical protein TELCIR_15738, partial [Teladorsagia circumcincta]
NFEKDNLNLLDGSPFREKIQETMSSDGILTSNFPNRYVSVPNDFERTARDDTLAALEAPYRRVSKAHDRQSMGCGIADSTVDVSRRTTNDTSSISTFDDDTALILEAGNAFGKEDQNQQCNTVSNTSLFMSESADVGDTMRVFECLMPKAVAGDIEEPDRSHEMQISAAESTLLNSTNMEVTDWILRESVNEVHRIAQAHQSSVDIEPPTEAVMHNSTFVVESPLHNVALSDDVADGLKQKCDVAMDIVNETINLVTSETSFCADGKLSTSEISTTHSSGSQRSEMLSTGDDSIRCPSPPANTTITLETESRTTATKVSVDRRSSATAYSINESLNDANITRRDVSIMQIGSRFRPSTSSRDETLLSLRSLRDETICLSERIMFDSQSLQVKYLDPADDQPQSNLIREEILGDLQRKLIEVKENSAAEFNEMLPELHAVDPIKATAVKNMDMRALSLDDAELLMCSRMRAEIEWAQARTRVAEEAKSVVEQLLKNDEPLLKQLEEDALRCRAVDQLQREVDALRAELESLPSAEEALRIIEQSEQAAKEEEDLDDRILDLEIEELRLELELAKLRGQEIRRTNAELNEWACQLERNEARVRTLTREIQNFHAAGQ